MSNFGFQGQNVPKSLVTSSKCFKILVFKAQNMSNFGFWSPNVCSFGLQGQNVSSLSVLR